MTYVEIGPTSRSGNELISYTDKVEYAEVNHKYTKPRAQVFNCDVGKHELGYILCTFICNIML